MAEIPLQPRLSDCASQANPVIVCQHVHCSCSCASNAIMVSPARAIIGEMIGTVFLEVEPILQEKEISLDDLAERAGIEDVKVDKIKSSQISAIRFSTLANICDVLDCAPGDVLKYGD